MVKLTTLMMTLLIGCLPAIGMAQASTPTQAPKFVIFVPGFFNSFAPEYFSVDIVKTMQNKGFSVVVAQKLNPIGTIQDNGERVYQLFETVRKQNPKSEINVIGHSAGGLYALYAINKGAHSIKNLITVSTPFNGVEFVENWRENSWAFRELMRWSYLDGLRQLTTPFVQNFLKSVRVPPTLRIMAYAGYQPVNYDFTNAANMSAVLSVTDQFITGASDGIVSFQSALTTAYITTTQKTLLKINADRTYFIPLEHWEQVLDYRNFMLLGVRNITLIRDRQIQFYSGIANLLQIL